MIQKIELWNWECFEHAVLDNLSPGLNLIFGESDSGKTSILRALKLISYNNFDPRSVRTGKKNCKVRVETDKGWVQVTRGKENVWETCRNGEAPHVFSKIGKNILPEAAEIIGLKMVKLGDMELPVNVMEQAEGHFMLNELAGDNASGSMRAQIVDEISGLSGIETLIKEVSLDRHRLGRKVKEKEDQANELRESMHDKDMLDAEEKLLAEVGTIVAEHDRMRQEVEAMAVLFEQHNDAAEQMQETMAELKRLPNTKVLGAILKKAHGNLSKVASMVPLWDEHHVQSAGLADAEKKLSELPDASAISKKLRKAHEAMARSKELSALSLEHFYACEEVSQRQQQLDEMPDLDKVVEAIKKSEQLVKRATEARLRAEELAEALDEMDTAETKLASAEDDLAEAINERNEALADVDVCPLTLRPVSAECLKSIGDDA